jgi:uncharacterized membrane protein HdeD (DUF308 family)
LIQTLTKNWWLLGLVGILFAIMSVIYLIIYETTPDVLGGNGFEMSVNRFALAAGACTIAASIWRSANGKSWPQLLMVLNGLTLGVYGAMPLFWRGPLSFNFFALLLVVVAMTFGILALAIARALRRRVADRWFFGLAGAVSVGFAFVFLALANHWIQLERRLFHPSVFLWLCAYFAFNAICILGLALRLHKLGTSQSDQWNAPAPLASPKHAH